MRDLERIRERDEASGSRAALWLLAGGVALGLISGGAFLIARPGGSADPADDDPLTRLDRAAGLSARAPAADEDERAPEVSREELSFPSTLIEQDSRPEVAAALAAAGAEADHPDPLPGTTAAPVAGAGDTAARAPAPVSPTLPAAVAAGPAGPALARAVERDPLVAAALPPDPAPRRIAPRGYDGEYTIQIISYDEPNEARAFADSLRARGHQAFVVSADIPERGRYWRVRVGPFETLREAEAYRERFEHDEHMNTIVVKRPHEGEGPVVHGERG